MCDSQLSRVFSKDAEGCIHPDEIKSVLRHLPSQLDNEEIQQMIDIVDKNNDGKISYSEFRVNKLHLVLLSVWSAFQVMLGAIPLLLLDDPLAKS